MAVEDQAKVNAVPPQPPPGEIVSKDQLYATQISLYRNAQAFGGQKDPSTIWSSMTRNEAASMIYYRELEEKDEDVGNALDTLKLKVLERDHNLLPGDDSQLGLDVRDFIEAQLKQLPDFYNVIDCMLDSVGYGFSVQELMFDTSAGQIELTGINDCPQELFLFGPRFQPQIGQLQFLPTPYAMEGALVPEQKFLVMSYRKRSRNRMGRPLLKSVFWPSWFKRNIQRLWLQYAEKGPGTAVVRYNDADNVAERQQAVAIAQAIVERTAIAVPQNFSYDVELLKVARALDPAVHEHFFKAMQMSIIRKILGETLTSFGSEGGAGSRSMGNTHADTLETRSVALCGAVQSVINGQLIRNLVLWNYGPDAPMPIWSFDVAEEEDLAKRIGIDAEAQRMGVPMSVSYMQKRYDIEAPSEGDVLLTPNVNGPQVSITDTTRGTFSEGGRAQANADLAQFDQVFTQLQDQAEEIFKERIREVAAAVKPAVVKDGK